MSIEIDYFSEITPNISIGSRSSLYKYHLFDVVVDISHPSTPDNVIDVRKEKDVLLYKCFVPDIDHPIFENDMYQIMKKVLPDLINLYKNNENIRILFHCKAGVSRSVSLALAFLCKVENIRIEEGLSLIQSKRSSANPNPSFVNAAKRFLL